MSAEVNPEAAHSRTHALAYLGRLDEQVKVRGFRIEPGEIEAALRRHPAVTGAVVVAREDEPGDTRLVGYVTGDVRPDELRAHLRGCLPGHMVPGVIEVLDAFPLTTNDKVDRRALPAPRRGADERHAPPRTPTEQVLAGVWSEVLRVDAVGAFESFMSRPKVVSHWQFAELKNSTSSIWLKAFVYLPSLFLFMSCMVAVP